MPWFTTALVALVALFASGPSFSQTGPTAGNATRGEHSTPEAAVRALINAIERRDVAAVAALMELPLTLNEEKRSLLAQRYIVSSRLQWALEEKFGQRESQRMMRVAHVDYLPKVDADQLSWQSHEVPNPPGTPGAQEGVIWSGVLRMVKTSNSWKLNLTGHLPAILVLDIEDAPWRIRMMEETIDGLNAGKLSSVEQVLDALIPRAPAQVEPVKADRSTPAGAIAVAADAIERGDAATLADSFEMMDGDDDGMLRREAERTVLERKVENAIRARFVPDQAERIVTDGFLRRGLLVQYQHVVGWVVEGDVARAALKEGWYDVTRRMVRRDGIWRMQLPPQSTMPGFNDETERLKQEARRKSLQEVLDHPEKFATAGALLDVLDVSRKDMPKEADAGASMRRRLEEKKREMAMDPPRTPAEAAEQALALSLWELSVAVASKDAKAAAKHYFAEGDDGAYVFARENRVLAARELVRAASREIGGEAGGPLNEFELTNLADDVYALYMLELKIHGDRAVPSGDTHGEWVPGIRRISGEWKLDVSDETGGKPREAAKRADEEARKIADLTIQVKAGKFSNMDQLREAMKAAGIRGSARRS